jgi:hypothetical protein
LRELGNDRVKFTRYDTAPGIPTATGGELKGHASFELAFRDPDLFSWLLQHSLE